MSRFSNRMVLNEDKWLANLLDKESSLCYCHIDLIFLDEVEID